MKKFSTFREALFLVTHPSLWFRRYLSQSDFSPNPIEQFTRWYAEVQKGLWGEFPNWLCLSTIDEQGMPDGRIVLLKSYDERGFVFYTNTTSRKGASLERHPATAMTFFWERFQRQVRISGSCEQVAAEEADRYFSTRPRASQIGAWASLQSQELSDRSKLEERISEFEQKFANKPVPRPEYWTGYRLIPQRFEFWELRMSRLHDRFEYTVGVKPGEWNIRQLYP